MSEPQVGDVALRPPRTNAELDSFLERTLKKTYFAFLHKLQTSVITTREEVEGLVQAEFLVTMQECAALTPAPLVIALQWSGEDETEDVLTITLATRDFSGSITGQSGRLVFETSQAN